MKYKNIKWTIAILCYIAISGFLIFVIANYNKNISGTLAIFRALAGLFKGLDKL